MDSEPSWSSTGESISLVLGDASCEAIAGDSLAGLNRFVVGTTAATGRLLTVTAVDAPLPPPDETYVRGDDWVSTHPTTNEWPFRLQAYRGLRRLPSCRGFAMTLTLSLQTPLLETRPRLLVSSYIVDKPLGVRGDRAVAELDGFMLASTPHPTDASECETVETPDGSAAHEFAPSFLEKGVIRRVRFALVAFPSDQAPDAAIDEWSEAPLPLTA
ncbi:MAG: hypothetical protein AAF805_02270 [Planctomycetota bacterium]